MPQFLVNFNSLPTVQSKKNKQHYLRGSCVFTTPEEQHCLEIQAARFVSGFLSTFTLVDNPNFVKLCQMPRPGSLPPKREAVANNLLNEVFAQEVETAAKEIRNERATLLIDCIDQ